MNRSFRLITLFNIPVEINYSWFIIVGLIILTFSQIFSLEIPGLPLVIYWLISLVFSILFFASLLAHEFSHSLVAIRNRLPIHGITLFIFGGVAHMEKEPASPAIELKMALAGPTMSFFLAIVFFVLTQILFGLGVPNYIYIVFSYLAYLNLIIGTFNLLPGYPLDGGRVLRALLWIFFGIKKATRIASVFGKIFALLLMVYGLLVLFYAQNILGIWNIFIGLFLYEAADISYQQLVLKRALTGVKVAAIMTRSVVTVPAELTLDKLVDEYFFRFRFTSFPVVRDDQLLGLVTLHAVKEIAKERWPQTSAGEIMAPVSASLIIDQDQEVIDALGKMAGAGLGRLLVAEDGKLIGILTQRDITRLFEMKSRIEED